MNTKPVPQPLGLRIICSVFALSILGLMVISLVLGIWLALPEFIQDVTRLFRWICS